MATINYNEKDLQAPLEELKNRFNRLCRQSENMIQIKADNNKEKSLTKETRWTQFFNKLRLTIRKTLDALKKSVKMQNNEQKERRVTVMANATDAGEIDKAFQESLMEVLCV
jgi:hypothetical protein